MISTIGNVGRSGGISVVNQDGVQQKVKLCQDGLPVDADYKVVGDQITVIDERSNTTNTYDLTE